MNDYIFSKSEMTIEDLFVTIFVFIDDFFKVRFQSSNIIRRSPNHNPAFTDAEVVTVQIVGELLGIDSQRAWLNLAHKNWKYLFPKLPERTRFGRRVRKLYFVFGLIQENLGYLTDANLDNYYIVDSFPLTLCNLKRLSGSKCPFENYAAVCKNASKGNYYYGMKAHLATDLRGIPRFIFLTPAHVSDVATLEMMIDEIHRCNNSPFPPIVIGDKGYVGEERGKRMLEQSGIQVVPIQRNYDKERGETGLNSMIKKTRKIIETTISLLVDQFNMAKTRTRSVLGLATSMIAKTVALTSCCLMNLTNNEPVLHVKQIAF